MAERPFIFIVEGREALLPVTPESYTTGVGINMEVVNIHQLGDVVLAGNKTNESIGIEFLIPHRDYSFSNMEHSSEEYVELFNGWVKEKKTGRFIVGGTGVNIPVRFERFEYSEKDGSNDIYASFSLRENIKIEATKVQLTNGTGSRAAPMDGKSTTDYLIKKGDTISALCNKFYGASTPEMWDKLALANNVKNRDLIYTGNTLKIPQPL